MYERAGVKKKRTSECTIACLTRPRLQMVQYQLLVSSRRVEIACRGKGGSTSKTVGAHRQCCASRVLFGRLVKSLRSTKGGPYMRVALMSSAIWILNVERFSNLTRKRMHRTVQSQLDFERSKLTILVVFREASEAGDGLHRCAYWNRAHKK
jgi:hypothetical protein